MEKKLDKEKVINHKKAAIKKLNHVLEKFINDPSAMHLKKANLISYWLESYSTYLDREETFVPTKLISYKRGDIIKADFGFNIGSEHGGLHYAVVLDINNKHNSPVITVIPLSSGTEKDVYERDIFLGNELYSKILSKHKILLESALNKAQENKKILSALYQAQKNDILTLIKELEKRQAELDEDISSLEKYKMEIDRMKQGSIAMMEQITTISKMRIYVPRKSRDILYGISFSSTTMDKINNQMKYLYIK